MSKKYGIEITLESGREFMAAIKKIPRGRGRFGSPGGMEVSFPSTAVKLGTYPEEAMPSSTNMAQKIFDQVACNRCSVKGGEKIKGMVGSPGGGLTEFKSTCRLARSEGERYTPCQGIKNRVVRVIDRPGREPRVISRRASARS